MLQTMVYLLLISLASPAVRFSAAQEGLTLRLKEETTVRSSPISLKDVVDIREVDPGQFQELGRIQLGTAPEDGSTVVLTRAHIQECIQSTTGSLSMATLIGADAVLVRGPRRQADLNMLFPALKSSLLESTSWKGSDVEIRSIGGVSGVDFPVDTYEARLSSKATFAGPRRMLAPVEIIQAGKTSKRFWITVDVTVRAPILTAAKNIAVDRIITVDDIVESVVEIPDLRISYARRPEDLLGKSSRRLFSPGDPLTRDAFSEAFLVRHGETVQLRLERNGIVVTSPARAEQDGRLGQMIMVRNLEFSTSLKAEVAGRGLVKVQ